jgi:hypothetical protein
MVVPDRATLRAWRCSSLAACALTLYTGGCRVSRTSDNGGAQPPAKQMDASAPVGEQDGSVPDAATSPSQDQGAIAVDSGGAQPVGVIVSGNQWNDQNGVNLQGHGGNIIQVGNAYYWFGEDKVGENASNAYFRHVSCSRSTDLVSWSFVGNALSQQTSGDLGPMRIVERPRVVYNAATSRYVMYMHIDTPGYQTAEVGVATSPTVCGPYSYAGSFKPLGLQSWDMNLFVDDDATAYLLTHAGDGKLHIEKLSADYLTVETSVAALTPNYEAPAMFKLAGRYYLFGSQLTGWDTNDNSYTTATSLSGPWSAWQAFAPTGSSTYNSQTMFVLPIKGSQQTTFVFMGDRWNAANLGDSTYVWLPLDINGTTLSITWYSRWSLDVSRGQWSADPNGIAAGKAYKLICYRSGYALDASGGATNGTAVVQHVDTGSSTQRWRVSDAGGGYFALINDATGLALDNGNTTTNGASVIEYAENGGSTQSWQISDVGGGYFKLLNQRSGLALDNANTTADNAGVIQYTDNGGTPQRWQFILDP